jgi:hypothetical protein
MPQVLQEVIERHLEGLEGLPTPEIVAAICKKFASNSHKVMVLKFFLLESPLRAGDLKVLLQGIGQHRAQQLCQEVARIREHRLARGKLPLWDEANKS